MGWNGSETDGLRRPHRTENANCVAGEQHKPQMTENPDCAAGERHESHEIGNVDCVAGERYTPYGAENSNCAATGTPRERRSPHGAGPAPKAVSCRRRWARAAAALVVLGALGLLLGRVFAPGGGPVAAESVPAPPVGPVPSTGATDGPSTPRAAPSTQGPVPAPAKRLWRGVEVVSSAGAETNRDGAVVLLPSPAFRHPSDQLLAMALSAKPGEALPPLPLGPDVERDFLRSLEDPIEELPTDSADVRELKRRVAEARETLAGEVRAGRRVRDVLEEYQRGQEHTASVRLMAVREVEAVREAEGAEAARRFAVRANGTLRAGGVPEIPVPGGRGPADGDGGDEHGKETEGD